MFPVALTPEFTECLFDALNRVTLVAGTVSGAGARLFHTRVGFMVIVSDDPASYSPKDPIWRVYRRACSSVTAMMHWRSLITPALDSRGVSLHRNLILVE